MDNSYISQILNKNFSSNHHQKKIKNSDFEKMLRFSSIKGKKDLYDEALIYQFLSAKYPFLKNPNIEKKIKKTSFYGDSNNEIVVSSEYLINQYKKNPSLIHHESFKKQIREYWQNKIIFSDEKHFLDYFGRILTTNDYEIKLEKILWSGNIIKVKNFQNILNKVSANSRLKAKLRIDIQSSENIDELFRKFHKLDSQLNNDEISKQILLFDTIQWCRKHQMDEEAVKLLDIVPLKNRIENDKWLDLIKPFLRTALTTQNTRNYSIAYKIASNHNLPNNRIDYVEMEFFAGFIASEFLKDRDLALNHFINSYKYAKQDFRKARGAYWIAKCQKTSESKNKYLLLASQEITTFYGQLALKELNNLDVIKKYFIKTSIKDFESLSKHPLFKYYYYSLTSQNINLAKKVAKIFILSLKSKNEIAMAAQIATALNMTEISVYIGNIAMYNMNYVILEALYPIPYYKHLKFNQALNLAIIKRESNFQNGLVSNAGSRGNAHGLMQIIPAAGIDIAKGLGENYNHHSLLNSHINVKYGNFWLQHLAKKYSSSEILIAAAYNGGSGSVSKWIKILGDPRENNVNTLNWIEQISFRETRYYVQSVLASKSIYQYLINNK
jgi:soluble lytic murein transglycosylase